jgi:hypothetical protein
MIQNHIAIPVSDKIEIFQPDLFMIIGVNLQDFLNLKPDSSLERLLRVYDMGYSVDFL